MKFILHDHIIFNHASSRESYIRGLTYQTNNRVVDFDYDPEENVINSIVRGSDNYSVTVFFDNIGEIEDYDCNCPVFFGYYKACKHVVAVLKNAQIEMEKYKYLKRKDEKSLTEIFSFFENIAPEKEKQTLNLEVTYEYEKVYTNKFSSTLDFRVGTSKLYVVKNLRDFLKSIYDKTSLEFGKNFTYDPEIHSFSDEDQQLIDTLLELYENDLHMTEKSRYTYYSAPSIFSGKKIELTTPYLVRTFNILKQRGFLAKILNEGVKNVSIVEEDIPFDFLLGRNSDEMQLSLSTKNSVIPLTEKGIYFYCDGKIYHPSQNQQQYYMPFISKLLENKKNKLSFSMGQMEKFISSVLPYIKDLGNVKVDKKINDQLIKETLVSKIYFDKYKDGISAVIEFHYGKNIFYPFTNNEPVKKDASKIVVRNSQAEKNILSLFEINEFIVEKDKIYLRDNDMIFDFLTESFPKLQELSEVYYSDSFKNMRIKSSTFSGGVKIQKSSNMLEFSFNYDDIDPSEIENIFSSLKEKKKYHRLKDGSFLPLNTPELESISNLAEHLDISEKDLSKKVIELPKYRALYLDSLLRESELHSIKRSQDFKQMVQSIKEPEDMDFELPEKLKNILRDYQKTGYKWLKTLSAYGLGGILADDMGLGKTLQVISFVLSNNETENEPALVIAPTSLVYNWLEEVKKFVPDMKVLVVSGVPKDRIEQIQEIQNADLVVTSYPLIRKDIDMYKDIHFSYCFLDEAQHIKNPNTLNAKTVKQINSKTNYALTGTPIENSITELWSIFDFIMPGYLLSHPKFIKKFESPIMKNNNQKTLKELKRHIKPFIMRRIKRDVLKELPDKIESKMTCEMTTEQKKIYLAYHQKAQNEVALEIKNNGFEKSHIKILSILTRLRQICCHPSLFVENFKGESGKMQLLEEILQDAFDGGHRILLFSQFTSMLDIIKQHLHKQNIGYFYLDGSIKAEQRIEMVKAFNEGENNLFLISLKAGGTGLNLTGADMVIHFDPWWNPAVENQASDRAHRIGQKNVVQVMKLITKGTIEDKIFELQQKKKELIDSIIKPGETMLSKMSENEIKELFELG
ncbi:UNVERIFIED_CONTAM: SNF2 family DNA or RNA helicase [Acetivibrio alkalicellulosi]